MSEIIKQMKKLIYKLLGIKIKSKRVEAAERLLDLIELAKTCVNKDSIFLQGLCDLNVSILLSYKISRNNYILNTKAIELLSEDFPHKAFWFTPGDFESRINYLNKVKNE